MPVVGRYVSITEHNFGAASCHPHCKDAAQNGGVDEGDVQTFQETYPPSLNLTNFGYLCQPSDNSGGNYCAFITGMSVTGDTTQKIITCTFRNRSGPITIRLAADINA